MLHSWENLREDDLAVDVGELPLCVDLRVELSSACVLHDQVQTGQRLHHLIQTDDIRMVQLFHARYLPGQ